MTHPDPLAAARAALAGERAWLVGGAVRDRLLGRPTLDHDILVAGEPRALARRIARAAGGSPFPLNERFGGWRVAGSGWHLDVIPLRDGSLAADLAARDLTVNALAEPLEEGEIVDLHGGLDDLRARRLRMVSATAFADDPLRVMRLARQAVELDFAIEPATEAAARAAAPALATVSPERVFAELRRALALPDPARAIAGLEAIGAFAAWLPELLALRGVQQGRAHSDDVWDHTLAVLDRVARLDDGAELLAEPLGDELTRGTALRLAALLHDIAKPATRAERPDGSVGFPGHDVEGAAMTRAILRRLRTSDRLATHVTAIVRWHLRATRPFYERPLDRRTIYRYLSDCGPVAADVALLALADQRGADSASDRAEYHALLRSLLGEAVAFTPPPPLLRGDELARELDREPGPWLKEALARLAEEQFVGEVTTREAAIAFARNAPRLRRGLSPRVLCGAGTGGAGRGGCSRGALNDRRIATGTCRSSSTLWLARPNRVSARSIDEIAFRVDWRRISRLRLRPREVAACVGARFGVAR